MDTKFLESKFGLIGARVKFATQSRLVRADTELTVDVSSDRKGEFFDIRFREGRSIEINLLDVRPRVRHLLLMAPGGKFLCGHDERHLFAAAVPGNASNVKTAMEALKPFAVIREQARKRIRARDGLRRRNDAFIRQGEWFFVPAPERVFEGLLVMRNEPLSRGAGSKPHMCEYIYRFGGQNVYVSRLHPNGITEAQYHKLIARNPRNRDLGWQVMRRGMQVYARGRVWHPDHKTIRLGCWHRVFMNTENEAPAMRNLVFLD